MLKKMIAVGSVVGVMALAIGVVASVARADTQTASVGEAGTVTFSVDGGAIAFVDADPADGWDFTVEREDGRHLEVRFTDGVGGEVEFEAEIEDGVVAFGGDDVTSTTIDDGDSDDVTSTTVDDGDSDDVTSTTIDDDDRDDDSDDDADDEDGGSPVVPQELTFLAGDAGSVDVLVVGDEVVFSGVSLQPGWGFDVDHTGGSHVDVEFFHEDGRTLEFRVDADLQVKIETDS